MDGSHLIIAEQAYDLKKIQRVVIVGVGKAAFPMAVAMEEILGDRLETGIIVTKDGYAAPASGSVQRKLYQTRVFEAGSSYTRCAWSSRCARDQYNYSNRLEMTTWSFL